ncbi:DUF968 domain-containing protein [Bradyrhizobium liaoningense]|uniref:DUF968 domain-containing protein n=1 Tax=Bradyrhizobium liaoningense TaxID=43992 RepID=UPI001BA6DCEA|nr:DUF968 domain-containing protein [Bradyrhizobium liaoningense]
MKKQPRAHDEAYLNYVRSLPCAICGDTTTVEAAHLRVGSIPHDKAYGAMQMKSSDKWALPLCGRHHREQHTMNELEFWAKHGINPFELAISIGKAK